MNKLILIALVASMFMDVNAQSTEVSSGLYAWDKLMIKQGTQRVGRKLMEGSSPHFEFLEMHATTQEKGAKSAAPHAQKNLEEVIIVKEGTMKFTMDSESVVLGPGSAILIPPLAMQSLENIGNGPLTYYVMMFRSKKGKEMDRSKNAGGPLLIDADLLKYISNEKGGRINYFNRPTAMCENFEMHVTQLNTKGPSHAPHTHIDSEIILVINGQVELSIDEMTYTGSDGDLFLIKSNEMHGIKNIGEGPCKYFALRWRQ